jgi:hypothetical protein
MLRYIAQTDGGQNAEAGNSQQRDQLGNYVECRMQRSMYMSWTIRKRGVFSV